MTDGSNRKWIHQPSLILPFQLPLKAITMGLLSQVLPSKGFCQKRHRRLLNVMISLQP